MQYIVTFDTEVDGKAVFLQVVTETDLPIDCDNEDNVNRVIDETIALVKAVAKRDDEAVIIGLEPIEILN
jgi:hypothetical protein